jgi:hypothetical protein
MFLGKQIHDVLGPMQLGRAPVFGTQVTQEEQVAFEEVGAAGLEAVVTVGLHAEDMSGEAAVVT